MMSTRGESEVVVRRELLLRGLDVLLGGSLSLLLEDVSDDDGVRVDAVDHPPLRLVDVDAELVHPGPDGGHWARLGKRKHVTVLDLAKKPSRLLTGPGRHGRSLEGQEENDRLRHVGSNMHDVNPYVNTDMREAPP